jgi:hypothetical protein
MIISPTHIHNFVTTASPSAMRGDIHMFQGLEVNVLRQGTLFCLPQAPTKRQNHNDRLLI